MSPGWGCTGLEGVDPLQEPDKGLFFFFSSFNPPFRAGTDEKEPAVLTPMREPIVSGRLCYSRMDAGVMGADKPGQAGFPLFTVGPFIGRVKQEPPVEAEVAAGLRGRPLFVLSQASTTGQRARGWGHRGLQT